MKCPGCGKDSQGRFCSSCGTPLQGGACGECGAKLAPGTRFCTQCGAATGAAGRARPAARANENLGWYVAAGVLVILIAVVAAGMLFDRDGGGAPTGGPAAVAPMGGSAAGAPLTGTPREQADRLFNRIMGAREAGDTTQAMFFMPMGLQAYRGIPTLDNDGLFHLSMLETIGGEHAAALATANRILESNPNHLLGLASAAEASNASGDAAAARQFWQRFLDAFEAERGKALQEYQDHEQLLPEYQATARGAVGR